MTEPSQPTQPDPEGPDRLDPGEPTPMRAEDVSHIAAAVL